MQVDSIHPHWSFHITMPDLSGVRGDVWGGFAAMLVALPSSVAFGVATYSVFGPQFAAQGAVAGVIGAAVLGLVAPSLGGAPRLVSAPCAPAAAMMTALAVELAAQHSGHALQPGEILLMLSLVALSAGLLQLVYGLAGGGQLIKYIPFPVISGYLTAVGLIILLGQLPSFFGVSKGIPLWHALTTPASWLWPNVLVGCATIAAVLIAPKIARALPAPIWGLAGGMGTYALLSVLYPDYFAGHDGRMVIGAISGGASMVGSFVINRWAALANFHMASLFPLLVQPLILSILLSIDTLKTCVVVDTLTRSRHNSNRELIGQGVANSL
ncbi:MAG TPA: SulP family inorganic anion transporter, partial [Terriglobia bacterium]|nr:SulP family inorganic anion transporter [Terriglobia bacterium]